MANARMQLKELCDRHGWRMSYTTSKSGPDHAASFTATVVATTISMLVAKTGTAYGAFTKAEAMEEACADALGLDDDFGPSGPQAQRGDAWVGDAAQEMLIALLGLGLSAEQLDGVSQLCASNVALAAAAAVPLTSVTATATAEEARAGRSVAAVAAELLDILLPAMQDANANFVAAVVSEVAWQRSLVANQ